MDDDLGVSLLPLGGASPAYSLPRALDALDFEAARAPKSPSASASAAADDDNDDEFNHDSGVDAAPMLSSVAATAKAPSSAAAALIGSAAAAEAFAAVRASLAAASAAEAAAEAAALEARVMSSMLLPQAGSATAASTPAAGAEQRAGGGLPALAAVGEEEEEEEEECDEGDVEEDTPAPHNATTLYTSAHAASATASDVVTGGGEDEDEVAQLAAAFEGATATVLAASGSGATATSTSAATKLPPLSDTLAAAACALLDSVTLEPFFHGIVPSVPDPSGGCLSALFAHRLVPAAHAPRDAVFALAKRPYDGLVGEQVRLMSALYAALRGTASSVHAPGAGWTDVGFQRDADFTTDLRGVGMLGPLQVLDAAVRHASAVALMWSASSSALHPFPFMVQCLALTAKTLHALRIGKLTRAINARMSSAGDSSPPLGGNVVLEVANDWFAGLVLDFALAWRADPAASLARIGHIQLAVVSRASARPDAVLSRLSAWEVEKAKR